MRILVVEDEPDLARLVVAELQREGFAVDLAQTGGEASSLLDVNDYDALVLDRGLPDISGDEICRDLAMQTERPRILMLTASGDLDDLVQGLSLGADDYLGKPFAMKELIARLRALGRRPSFGLPVVLTWMDVELNAAHHRVSRGERQIVLTRKEFAVLEQLLQAQGAVVSSETLLGKVWDEEVDPFTNVVRVTMTNLRRKLGGPQLIETIVGIGYRLKATS